MAVIKIFRSKLGIESWNCEVENWFTKLGIESLMALGVESDYARVEIG